MQVKADTKLKEGTAWGRVRCKRRWGHIRGERQREKQARRETRDLETGDRERKKQRGEQAKGAGKGDDVDDLEDRLLVLLVGADDRVRRVLCNDPVSGEKCQLEQTCHDDTHESETSSQVPLVATTQRDRLLTWGRGAC